MAFDITGVEDLEITGDLTVADDATVGGDLAVAGNAEITGNLEVTGTITTGGASGIGFGTKTRVTDVNGSVLDSGTLDLVVDGGTGGSCTGILTVSNVTTANAGTRTQKVYAVMLRGTENTLTPIGTHDGGTAAASFTLTVPASGTLRFTNTSGATTTVVMSWVGQFSI